MKVNGGKNRQTHRSFHNDLSYCDNYVSDQTAQNVNLLHLGSLMTTKLLNYTSS